MLDLAFTELCPLMIQISFPYFLLALAFYLFHVPHQESLMYAIEGLQNLGLCSVLRAFDQRGIFIVPHLL
jgi:hypothetical protein